MLASMQAVQDPVVAKIRALLLAAKPQLQADEHALGLASSPDPLATGEPLVDPVDAIGKLRQHLQSLRASVLAQPAGAAGSAAANARDLTAQTLQEVDQSLDQLTQSYNSDDPEQVIKLRDESVRLLGQAADTSVKAGAALGIPWPL